MTPKSQKELLSGLISISSKEELKSYFEKNDISNVDEKIGMLEKILKIKLSPSQTDKNELYSILQEEFLKTDLKSIYPRGEYR